MQLHHRDFLVAEQAAAWLLRLQKNPSEELRREFCEWLRQSPQHVLEFLLAQAVDTEFDSMAACTRSTSVLRTPPSAESISLVPRALRGTLRRNLVTRWLRRERVDELADSSREVLLLLDVVGKLPTTCRRAFTLAKVYGMRPGRRRADIGNS